MASNYTFNVPTNLTYTATTTATSINSFASTYGTVYTSPMYTYTTGGTWEPNGGCTTSPLEDYSALATRWQDPEHFFQEDEDGSCSLCEQGNVHRFSETTHPLVINEEPDADDWQQLLAS